MKKGTLYCFLIWIFSFMTLSVVADEIKSIGVPYIHNYPKSVYLSGNQNWWMTKYKDKYYLQYGAPATEFSSYADGVAVGKSPLGPFEHQSLPFFINQAVLHEVPGMVLHFKITGKITGMFRQLYWA